MRIRVPVFALFLGLVCLPSRAAEAPRLVPDGAGGGEYRNDERAPHLTDEQRGEIRARIDDGLAKLRAEGKLAPAIAAHPALAWPLRPSAGFVDFGFHGIGNFVDQDPAYPDHVLDWNCGDRSYDVDTGYNHPGTDIFLWPFPWLRMQNDDVEVVAAAAGTIVLKSDGNFDHNCGPGNPSWNAVYVAHADGSVAWYGHLKVNSLTPKPVGAAVAQGEYLGVVGSSGNSSTPHLHFEVYDSSGLLNDPFAGPCNALNADSWWAAQPPYYDPAINHLSTGFAEPDAVPACPTVETPNEKNAFNFGETIYFTSYYRDQLHALASVNRIYRPDGSVYATWSDPAPPDHYSASYWYVVFFNVAPSGPAGTWRFEVTYDGRTYTHPFTISSATAAGRVPELSGGPQPPLTLAKVAGGQVKLTWGASCDSGDTDYEIYTGIVGAYYTHVSTVCSTSGAKTWTLPGGGSSSYYLVVPANGVKEGSYGTRTGGAERPTGSFACLPRELGGCP